MIVLLLLFGCFGHFLMARSKCRCFFARPLIQVSPVFAVRHAERAVLPDGFSQLSSPDSDGSRRGSLEDIIVDQHIRDSLLSQAILNFTLPPKVDRAVVSGTVGHKRVELAPEVYDRANQNEIRAALGVIGKQLLPNVRPSGLPK